jgi:hypothetical protein
MTYESNHVSGISSRALSLSRPTWPSIEIIRKSHIVSARWHSSVYKLDQHILGITDCGLQCRWNDVNSGLSWSRSE